MVMQVDKPAYERNGAAAVSSYQPYIFSNVQIQGIDAAKILLKLFGWHYCCFLAPSV